MGTEKISVTLEDEELQWARRQAKAKKLSLSAVITSAVRRSRQAEARSRLVARSKRPVLDREIADVVAEWTQD